MPPSTDTDPALFAPTPATGAYDGTTLVNSGVLPARGDLEVQKFSMSFGKTGTYTYYCVLHPNMVGTLTVTGDTQDSQQKITKTGNQEKAKYLKEGEAAKKKLTCSQAEADQELRRLHHLRRRDGRDDRAHRRARVRADAEEGEGGRPGHLREQLGRSAHRQLRRRRSCRPIPTAADVLQPRARRLAAGARPGRLPQHRVVAAQVEGGPPLAARSYTYSVPGGGQVPYACVLHLPSGMAAEIDAS